MNFSGWCASLVLLSSAVFNAAPVAAQAYPHKPVRVIIPYAPGGGSDIILRSIAPRLSEHFGQSVVIDNRPGGSSTIGTGLVARSAPDGYTLLLVDSAILVNASITWGVFAPAGTPKEIVGRVNAAFNQTLQAPESRLRLADLGFVAGGGTPEAWATEVRASIARWAQVVKQAHIKTE